MARPSEALTDEAYWDDHWDGLRLPVERTLANSTPYVREILRVLARFTPTTPGSRVLEIGAAPGGYLAFFARMPGSRVVGIDSSPAGIRKLVENFRLLGLGVETHENNVLRDDLRQIEASDMVFSLGLIEHFSDPLEIVRRHIELAVDGGIIAIGVPNFRGVNNRLIRLLSADKLEGVNLRTMDINAWKSFERELGLETLFKGYVGGWEPRLYLSDKRSWKTLPPNLIIGVLVRVLDRLPIRSLNSPRWSGYVLGVYRTPALESR